MAHITISPVARRVTVSLGGEIIADTVHALALKEDAYPSVFYIPKPDIKPDQVARTMKTSFCPHKGEASYWTISVGGETAENAGWSYDDPIAEVAQIKDHIAFYPDKVEIETA